MSFKLRGVVVLLCYRRNALMTVWWIWGVTEWKPGETVQEIFAVIYVRAYKSELEKCLQEQEEDLNESKNIQEVEWIGLGGDWLRGDRGE